MAFIYLTTFLPAVRVRAVPDVSGGVLRLDLHDAGGDGGALHRRLPPPPVQDHLPHHDQHQAPPRLHHPRHRPLIRPQHPQVHGGHRHPKQRNQWGGRQPDKKGPYLHLLVGREGNGDNIDGENGGGGGDGDGGEDGGSDGGDDEEDGGGDGGVQVHPVPDLAPDPHHRGAPLPRPPLHELPHLSQYQVHLKNVSPSSIDDPTHPTRTLVFINSYIKCSLNLHYHSC